MLLSAGGNVDGQHDRWARFAVITYMNYQNSRQFVFSARQWESGVSSYICQLQQGLFKYDNTVRCHASLMLLCCFVNDVEFDMRWQQKQSREINSMMTTPIHRRSLVHH